MSLNPAYSWRLRRAYNAFYRAEYEEAYSKFSDLVHHYECARSLKMLDWIDAKSGIFHYGWPAYPGFHSQSTRRGHSWHHHQDPNLSYLRDIWRLSAWTPFSSSSRPVIWFNFVGSLGGELLGLALVLEAINRFGLSPTLVVDSRIESFVRRVLPGVAVLPRSGSVSKPQNVDSYLLVRDLLGYLVNTEADFSAIREGLSSRKLANPDPIERRVGFTWKTTNSRQARFRNMSIAQASRLLSNVPGPLVSLQHGVTRRERTHLGRVLGDRVSFDFNPWAEVDDMGSQISRLAAVITVDNSILHLAGFIGTPTVGLLAKPSYWAWPKNGQESRWYSAVHLVHQAQPGDWSSTFPAALEVLGKTLFPVGQILGASERRAQESNNGLEPLVD